MDKPAESRSGSSGDNKKSNHNPHLSDEQLLLTLDGESSASEAEAVEVHLEACWSCRARREQIEKAIGYVVEYRDHLIRPYSAVSASGRAMFVARLEQLARSVGRPPLWSRIVKALRVFGSISQRVVPRHVWIGALVVASFALFVFTRFWEVRGVSASQLLENAQISEIRALHSVAKPVVYQKLRIRIGTKAVMRTIYRDPVGMREAEHLYVPEGGGEPASDIGLPGPPQNRLDSVQTAQVEFQRTFLTAHLNWQDPLSPGSYSAWHNSLREKHDEVTAAGDDFLTLKTTTPEGPIAQAQITVRTADFHPVAEDILLQDTSEVEVKELAWEVLPIEAVNPTIFSPGPTLPPEIARPANLVSPSQGLTDAQLAEAELQARVAMHAERADLGEQIELDRNTPSSGQRSVIIRGIVGTPERKNNLLAALRGIPHVELRVQTVEEAAAQQNRGTADKSEDAEPQIAQEPAGRENRVAGENVEVSGNERPAVVVVGSPALEQQLEERFPKAQDRAAFIDGAVELVQDAVAQAWALRRLRDRYTPGTVAELSRGSQQTLELLIRDDVSALRRDVDATRDMVSPLVPTKPVAPVPPPPMPDARLSSAAPSNDWGSAVTEIFPETQRVCDDVVALLAESGKAASETQALVLDLQLALAKLETQLPVLYDHASGPFLSEPKNKEH
jgi:hypothetical protein